MDKFKIVWPTKKPLIIKNFLDTGLDLFKEEFGALSQDSTNPLSRVCIANSSFSLEPVRGCPMGCSYCIVGSDLRNLGAGKNTSKEFKKLYPRKPEVVFPGKILAKALIKHPAFIRDKSIISISTGSSEAFIPISEKETWDIMSTFAENGLKNPFWIVTKRGIPDNLLDLWLKRFEYLLKQGINIVISITDSNAPYWVEPYRQNRFHNFAQIKKIGVHISHHLRPIIRGINDSVESLNESLNNSLGLVESICVGGLRKDPGVLLSWRFAKNLNPNLLPDVSRNIRKKDLTEGALELVKQIVKKKGYNTPVFSRSSQAISYAVGILDFNLYRYRTEDNKSFLRIPEEIQKAVEKKFNKPLITIITELAKSIKLDSIKFNIVRNKIIIKNKINYQENRALIHVIGHSDILP